MRVTILTQYFTPEIGATSARLHAFASGLADRGHDVEVIAQVPNHPQGVTRPEFRGRAVVRRRLDGFRVTYVWVATKPDKTTRDRLAFYGSYVAMAVLCGSLRARPDVVFASSPPLPVGAAAAALARRYRVPWVLDVRDLWPQAAAALGELSNPRLLRAAERLETFLYRDAAAATAVTRPFVAHVKRIAAGATPVHFLPNGTTQFWLDAAALPPDRAAAGLPADEFTWTFAGNVGLAQGLESAIDAAALLGPGFRLVILGDGAARSELERRARQVAPAHVEFRDQVTPEHAARALRASDALLVSLSAAPELEAFVPSKLFDFCALERPVIVAAAGEPQRRVGEADAALLVPPGDARALASTVRRIAADPRAGEAVARRGRDWAAHNLREHHIGALESLLGAVAAPSAPS